MACQGSPRSTANNNNLYTLGIPGILTYFLLLLEAEEM